MCKKYHHKEPLKGNMMAPSRVPDGYFKYGKTSPAWNEMM
jgi:hypothetical protein